MTTIETEINRTPIVDELRRILREGCFELYDRAHKAMAAIPMVLPGEDATEAEARSRIAEEAYACAQIAGSMRDRLSQVIIALDNLEVVARQNETMRHASVVAEVNNIWRLTAELDQAAGQAKH